MPSGAELLQLEAQARRAGTDLAAAELVGCWRLRMIWPKGSLHAARLSGLLLQALQATLLIGICATGLTLCNSVQLGPLQLRFLGPGALVGRRPLLQFRFERLELRWQQRVLLGRVLAAPEPKRMAFFALIGRDPSGWLAARGRGGGVALWELGPAVDAN